MRLVCEGLDSDVARSGPGIVVFRRELAGKNPVCGEAERVHDVRSDQIRITDSQSLIAAVISRAGRRGVAEQNVSDVVRRGDTGRIQQVSAEYRVAGAALIIDS